MFPQFDFLAQLKYAPQRMKQQTAPSRQTPTRQKRSELKLQMNRAKRDRLKAAKKANRGNQFHF